MRTHAQTAGVSLTAQQPYNNVVRVTLQALAAVLGGTQSLHTNSLDETYALPTEEAVTLALRTQQVIAHEPGVADTIDPLAGSYYLESPTQRRERGDELMPRFVECARANASVGEQVLVLKEVFGEYHDPGYF